MNDTIYTFREKGELLIVVAHTSCPRDGKRAVDVAEIHDPGSVNPGLRIPTPLGIHAIEEIIAIVRSVLITPRTNKAPGGGSC